MTEEDSCSNCAYCEEVYIYEYNGYCKKMGYYLKTIDDRLCEEFLRSEI